MSTPTAPSSPTPGAAPGTTSTPSGGALATQTELHRTTQGRTTIADGVVQKIAGLAAREVAGVHALGGGTARALGSLRERIPGASQSASQGVSVEVGETQAAVDLDIVTEYGVSIADVARAVRRNVISAVEGMTELQVTEVNVSVNDIHLPSDDDNEPESRVQ
ncbi:Asp23/Gls24 family envelope stress response protein [Sanguibacter suarezii]|uniref:Asp23/Gls24 family envelope stress response protein n=1 Tax=Sanguibacter suarezii TaxID=60921 RepID=UPI000830592C|nr:Asp23/Gls24 family envelope stress response protein [Sanguibacter suarezii]